MIYIDIKNTKNDIVKKHLNTVIKKKKPYEKILRKLYKDANFFQQFETGIQRLANSTLKTELTTSLLYIEGDIKTNGNNKVISESLKEIKEFEGLRRIFILEKNELSHFATAFKNIFGASDLEFLINAYEHFRGGTEWKTWNAVEYIKCLKLRTCPYCNMAYIHKYEKKNTGLKTTAQLDHYYPKDEHPLLALSIFNLIPVCSSCNLIKSNIKDPLVHPFYKGFGGKAKFKLKNDEKFLKNLTKISAEIEKIEIFISKASDLEINNSIEKLYLKERYDNHKIEVIELIDKYRMFDENKITELKDCLKKIDPKTTRSSVKATLFGNEIKGKKYKDKILSKFTKDIIDDLKVKL